MTSADDAAAYANWALFLDVDGTLLEIAETPQAVHVAEDLKQLLSDLGTRLGGALALVTGRTIADLDTLFAPFQFVASGVHGSEYRDATGRTTRPLTGRVAMDLVRQQLAVFAAANTGLLLEDKGHALALHFRQALQLEPIVRAQMSAALGTLGPEFALQEGKCVLEIRHAGYTKGIAIARFLEQAPFRGRTPIFFGDDTTDEPGFAIVNAQGGVSVRVGQPGDTLARFNLSRVTDVIRALQSLPPFVEVG
jgi:trehalose 6-phosphate phosphatase